MSAHENGVIYEDFLLNATHSFAALLARALVYGNIYTMEWMFEMTHAPSATQILQEEYDAAKASGAYFIRNAGDTQSFRYPVLKPLQNRFAYSETYRNFILRDYESNSLSKIAAEDITLYEMLVPEAKRLHLFDMLGYASDDEEKLAAYRAVQRAYDSNQQRSGWDVPMVMEMQTLHGKFVRPGFKPVANCYARVQDIAFAVCMFDTPGRQFQFGSMVKGTNIIFTDASAANIGQDFLHGLYHMDEGIPGCGDDNLHIDETWACVPALYLMQLLEGRGSRRIRHNFSPHDIKFLDYIFLRAYLGQAFAKDDPLFHPVFSVIEPTLRLLVCSLPVTNDDEINVLLTDGMCHDNTAPIRAAFDMRFGKGAYETVFHNFRLFSRLASIRRLCEDCGLCFTAVQEEMFDGKCLLHSALSNEVVRLLWSSSAIQTDGELVVDLLENIAAPYGAGALTIQKWLSEIASREYSRNKYDLVYREAEDLRRCLS